MSRHSLSPGLIAFLLACLAAPGLSASEHHGVVQSGGLPVPGATVSAIQGDKKVVTTTDDQGAYSFANLADGVWTIEVDMFGFSKLSREVGIAPEAPSPTWQLQVLPLSALTAPAPAPARTAPAVTGSAGGPPARRGGFARGGAGPRQGEPAQGGPVSLRQALTQDGFQQADVNAAADPSAVQADNQQNGSDTTLGDLNQSASNSLVVNGSVSGGLTLPQQNDWFAFAGRGFGPGGPGGPGGFGPGQNFAAPGGAGGPPGGPGGPGFGGPGGPGGRGGFGGGFGGGRGGFGRGGRGPRNLNAFGNGRRNRRRQFNGNVAFILDNSALDARPYSLTGQDTQKAAYARFRTTGFFGGPLKIPHLVSGENTSFTINYQLTRSRNANTIPGLVPTLAERNGDFSQAINPLTRQPVTLTGFANNIIPQSQISPQAQALLNLYPLPNFASPQYNYQVPIVSITNQNNVNARVNHTINSKNQVNGNFSWQSSNGATPNLFGFIDTNTMTGYNTGVNYTYHFTTRLLSNLRYNFSRQATQLTPYFANTNNNVSGAAGILGNDQAPSFYGPPSLSFSTGVASLSDGNPTLNHNTTNQVGENLLWIRGAHNVTFGVDYRRLDFNQLAQQNPRGTFYFTNTYTGFDLADFLIGLPSTTSVAYGNADKYFRASWIDLFVNDDWRINSRISINAGLRWDFQSPVTELYNRLVNVNTGANFTMASPVCATAVAGCTPASDAGYPNSLVRLNYKEFQPRIGFAWRPFAKASTVVRGGYGIYYNTSVYQPLAQQMAQQSPLSYSVTQSNSPTNPLFTMANAFLTPAVNAVAQTFAIDPNFQIGYLHYWQLSIQQNLMSSIVATITYNGDKGTHQMQEFLPNTFPQGIPANPALAGYAYLTSGANSNYNAVSFQLQRRFRSGLSGNLIYTFSKAIDDSQALGGRGTTATYAQNWQDLTAERSLSPFNRTHTLNANLQWSTGQGTSGGTLLSGWKGALAKDWTFTTTIALGSGLPETPIYANRLTSGTGINGTVRAEYLGGSLEPTQPGFGFNTSAFGKPLPGTWGDAGRYIIGGPTQFTLNGSAGRLFRIAERRSIDLRFDATNLLNHVAFSSWNTTVGSPLFGLPAAAGAMRSFQANLRFRF